MLKIQADGKGYGKPVNPNTYYGDHSLNQSSAYVKFDRDNPTLPIYLPNGDPYLGDDVVSGTKVKAVIKDNDVVELYDIRPTYGINHLGWKEIDCYRVHPVVTEQAEQELYNEIMSEPQPTYPPGTSDEMGRGDLLWLQSVASKAHRLYMDNQMPERDYMLLDECIDKILNNNGVCTDEIDF